jgi:ASC-1-like (ASCH) protein
VQKRRIGAKKGERILFENEERKLKCGKMRKFQGFVEVWRLEGLKIRFS